MRKRVPVLAETAGLSFIRNKSQRSLRFTILEVMTGSFQKSFSKKDRDAVDRLFKSSPGYSRLPDERRAKLYSFLLDFAGYAFNKSHSLSYAVIFWLAYFKSNHPEIFYPSCCENYHGLLEG